MTEEALQNWMTFIGIFLLGVKTISESIRKKSLNEIEAKIDTRDAPDADDTSIVGDIQDIVLRRRQRANRWTAWDGILMWLGYGLLIGGTLWRVL